MKPISIAVSVIITSLLISGCGTILNLRSGDPEVYGGVAKDVEYIMTPQSGGGGDGAAALLLIAGEVGLSLVGDTLTLPLVLRLSARRGEPSPCTPQRSGAAHQADSAIVGGLLPHRDHTLAGGQQKAKGEE